MKKLSRRTTMMFLLLASLIGFNSLAGPPTVTVLHPFGVQPLDGKNPQAGLLLAGGYLYGTTSAGGDNGNGTIFRVMTNGTDYSKLASFYGKAVGPNTESNPKGSMPVSRLLLGKDGLIYGTTSGGGKNDDGTIFRFAPPPPGENVTAKVETLAEFTGGTADEPKLSSPNALMQRAENGDDNFYGEAGPTSSSGLSVFMMTPKSGLPWKVISYWDFSVDHLPHGNPAQGIILAEGESGDLYGTILNGQVVVHAQPQPSNMSCNWINVDQPQSFKNAQGLLYYIGNYYGTTSESFFKLESANPKWKVTKLISFNNTDSDGPNDLPPSLAGSGPGVNLMLGKDGKFYGTTFGSNTTKGAKGTIFQISPPTGSQTEWTAKTLFTFDSTDQSSMGANQPYDGLIQDPNTGEIYGTTFAGHGNNGVVYKLRLPPPALVSITVTPTNSTITGMNVQSQFTATGQFDDGSSSVLTTGVTWSSGSDAIASIDATTGTATTHGGGSCTITATSGSGAISGSTTLTVTPKLISITVMPANATVCVNEPKATFTAIGYYDNNTSAPIPNAKVAWSSWNMPPLPPLPKITVIDDGGNAKISGNKGDQSAIIATVDGMSGSATLTVASCIFHIPITRFIPQPFVQGCFFGALVVGIIAWRIIARKNRSEPSTK